MLNIDELVARLNSDDRAVLHETIELLGDMRNQRAVRPLIALLKGADQGIKDAAVNAVVNIGGENAADAVIPLLYEEDNASLRNMAIEILERLGSDAEKPVIALLHEDDADIVKFAIDVIGNIGNPVLSSHLIPLLEHPNPNVRAAAINTLAKLKAFGAANHLVNMLKDSDEWVRFSVLEALGSLGSPDMVDRLIDALRNDDISKIAALDALSSLADVKDLKKVMSVISGSDIASIMGVDTATRFAGRFLAFLDDAQKLSFLEIFIRTLKNGDIFEKREALRGMGIIGKKEAMNSLLEFACEMDKNDEETTTLLRHTMATIGDSSTILKAIKEEPANIAVLSSALGDIGDPSSVDEIKSLVDKVDRETKAVLLNSLEKIEASSSFETLTSAIRDKDGHIRSLAARMLGKSGDRRAIPILYDALLNEQYTDVQGTIAEAMSMYVGQEVRDLFVGLLSHESLQVRVEAVQGLGRLKTETAKEPLINIINDSEPAVRGAAIKALGCFEDNEITCLVSGFLKDEDKGVRLAALEVVSSRDNSDAFIISALNDADIWVRFRAIELIADKVLKGAEALIVDILLNDEVPVKAACINALARIGSKESEYVLKGFIDHADPYIGTLARNALSQIEYRV